MHTAGILLIITSLSAGGNGAPERLLADVNESAGVEPDPFDRGVKLMDRGDFRGAIAAFRKVPGDDPSAALLEGISNYRLGDLDAAAPLLRRAERYPAHTDAARFYLGLVSMERGENAQASSYFDRLSSSQTLGPAASDLARLANRDGNLVLSVLAETGWDSNVTLTPDGTPVAGQTSDGGYALTGGVLYRPLGRNGPFVRGSGFLRQQLSLSAYDYDGLDVAAGWELGHGGHGLIAEYDYGYRTLGGASYLSAHRLSASGWAAFGAVALSASYAVRFDGYAANWTGFSGTLHRAEAKLSWTTTPKLRLALAYGLGRDATDQGVLAWLEHGPRAEAQYSLSRRARLRVETGVTFRGYDTFDPTFNTTRVDTYLDAGALAELDLGRRWTARAGVLGRKAFSNVSDFTYFKIVPTIGLSYVLGL